MVRIGVAGRRLYDVSFMVSLHCNLACSFCMYDSGPTVDDAIDFRLLTQFVRSIDPSAVNAFGLYGGEPSLRMEENTRVVEMLPVGKPVFVITNGAWSRDEEAREEFLRWSRRHGLHVVVSGTAEHVQHQDREWLERRAAAEGFTLKGGEEQLIPMGRLSELPVRCSLKCESDRSPTRVAVKPDGSVIFQTCDGQYPVVGHAAQGFPAIRRSLEQGRAWRRCPHWSGARCHRRYSKSGGGP